MERLEIWWARVSSWLVPLAIFLLGAIDITQNGSISSEGGSANFPGPAAAHFAFLVLVTFPLYWRKRYPVAVLWAVLAVTGAWVLSLYPLSEQPPLEPALAIMVGLYTVARETDGRRLLLGSIVGAAIFLGFTTAEMVGGSGIGNTFGAVLLLSLSWIVGRIVHRHFTHARSQAHRADKLEQEQQMQVARAAAHERARIARELHDVVAHSLSVIVVQAAAERRVIGDEDSPTRSVLESIELAGRQAMVELRRLLGVLRKDDDIPLLSPQPGLRLLPELTSELGDSGIEVGITTQGDLTTIPAGLDLSAYRIVQESLTNVVKHSRATRAEVQIHRQHQSIEIEVTDNGRGNDPDSTKPGFGLIGMRERVAVYGGKVDAGPMAGGGYRVRAVLPLEASEQVQVLS